MDCKPIWHRWRQRGYFWFCIKEETSFLQTLLTIERRKLNKRAHPDNEHHGKLHAGPCEPNSYGTATVCNYATFHSISLLRDQPCSNSRNLVLRSIQGIIFHRLLFPHINTCQGACIPEKSSRTTFGCLSCQPEQTHQRAVNDEHMFWDPSQRGLTLSCHFVSSPPPPKSQADMHAAYTRRTEPRAQNPEALNDWQVTARP